MISISIVSGTDRPGSNALKVARYVLQKYRDLQQTRNLDLEVDILDLQKFPTEKVAGGQYGSDTPKEVKEFIRPLLGADGLVIICPEYNGGYPGILKLFIDYLPFPESLNRKPVCFIGEANGAFGALRAVEQLQQVAGYRNAHIFPERVFIARVNKNFSEQEGIKESFQQNLLESQIENFVSFIEDLKK